MSDAAGSVVIAEKVYREYAAQGDAEEVKALRNVSFRIPKGGRVAIKGESGSGKSTLLNLLGGLDLPSRGSIVVNGQDLTNLSERELARFRATTVGFVFQAFNLVPTLTARENVELPMEAVNTGAAEAKDRALALLEAVGMEERAAHRPNRMSGGEQQRVAIARALANRPALVLADEPTGNLDTKSRRAVMRLLTEVNEKEGTTLVVVTHNSYTAGYCDTTLRIHRGRIIGQVTNRRTSETTPDPEEEDDAAADAADAEEESTGSGRDERAPTSKGPGTGRKPTAGARKTDDDDDDDDDS